MERERAKQQQKQQMQQQRLSQQNDNDAPQQPLFGVPKKVSFTLANAFDIRRHRERSLEKMTQENPLE